MNSNDKTSYIPVMLWYPFYLSDLPHLNVLRHTTFHPSEGQIIAGHHVPGPNSFLTFEILKIYVRFYTCCLLIKCVCLNESPAGDQKKAHEKYFIVLCGHSHSVTVSTANDVKIFGNNEGFSSTDLISAGHFMSGGWLEDTWPFA